MPVLFDARVPVLFAALDAAGPDDAVLHEGARLDDGRVEVRFTPGPGVLAIGCACCTPRGPLAEAIGAIFMARARGEVAFFRRLIAVPTTDEGRAAMLSVLTEDPLCAARFRLA